jgi:hypothetical protein
MKYPVKAGPCFKDAILNLATTLERDWSSCEQQERETEL